MLSGGALRSADGRSADVATHALGPAKLGRQHPGTVSGQGLTAILEGPEVSISDVAASLLIETFQTHMVNRWLLAWRTADRHGR